MDIQTRRLSELKPAEYNPRVDLKPGDPEYEKIRRSIQEFGYVDPIIINTDGTIIGGHQRYKILIDMGRDTAEVSVVDLSKEQEKALNIALNKTGGDWDTEKLKEIFKDLDNLDFDTDLTGFDKDEISEIFAGATLDDIGENKAAEKWFNRDELEGDAVNEGDEGYGDFVDKFKPKKTTDDCYTPEKVYTVIADWVAKEYGVNKNGFVRPFYPGGDYTQYQYPKDCVVVDNPPFSILAEILKFYTEKGIKFFLFAPALTLFSSSSSSCAIGTGANVIYENGANVNTSFLTNLEMQYRFRSAPELYKVIKKACDEISAEMHKELPKYSYPNEVVTSAMLSYYSKYGIDYKVKRENTKHIRQLDAQKEKDAAIFGSGYLVSEKAAAEKAAAEKAAAEKAAAEIWQLSEREKETVKALEV